MATEVTEIVDARTGEIIPPGANEIQALAFPAMPSLEKIGTLAIDNAAEKVLSEPLDPMDIKIRPDGNVYLPWTWYASRLNKAFGVCNWGLVPTGMPMSKPAAYGDVLIAWGHWLVIRGIPIGYAIGETTYRADNNMMSYADACEGAKSSSLARNCKILGMTLELWDADYVKNWKAQYAETYKNDKGKTLWKRKETAGRNKSVQKVTPPAPQPTAQPAPQAPAANGNGTRPYPPAVFKEKIAAITAKKAGEKATDFDRKVLASAVDGVFEGDKTMRYAVCQWLFGHASTKDMTDAEVKALMLAMEIKDFDQAPKPESMTELRQAYAEALKAQGQTTMKGME